MSRLEPKHVRVLRDRKKALPEAANIRIKTLRIVFKWAIENDIGDLTDNPARDVPNLTVSGDGHHSWSEQEREQFERCHVVGTKARLAYALIFFTGARRSDAVLLGPRHIQDGKLCFTQQKNRRRKPMSLELPILPELQQALDATSLGEFTFLVNGFGRPFTENGFGNKFHDWCVEAGLAHCSAHGFRKAAAARAAEYGATANELMAMFGWLTMKEAERYTRAAERKKLAQRGYGRLVPLKP